MLRLGECVAEGDVELVVADIVKEHVDTAQVVGGDIDLLPEEAFPHVFRTKYLGELQKKGAGAARGVIDLVHGGLAHGGYPCEKFGNFLRGVVFAAALARVGGIHAHEELIGITKGIDGVVLVVAEVHVTHAVKQLHQFVVTLGYGIAKLLAVHVKVVKQTFEVIFTVRSYGRLFYVLKRLFQRFVQVLIKVGAAANIDKEFTWQNEKTFDGKYLFTGDFSFLIAHLRIVNVINTGFRHAFVEVGGKVFRNIPVEQHPQNVLLEIPAVHATAKIVGDVPYHTMELCPLLFFPVVSHCCSLLPEIEGYL